MNERLKQQIDFIVEIDKLKEVYRQSILVDRSRRENDAEHTWHLTMMALILQEHANEPDLDLLKTLKMLIIHDLVEIDAGDTFAYDEAGYSDKREREERAAKRLFGMLPKEQGEEMYELWLEFEDRRTIESQYANAMDRFEPILLNYMTEGASWKKHGVTKQQVFDRNKPVQDGSEVLWQFITSLIDSAVEKGYLKDS
ncbi:putative hydrolase of HD superfamily [Scopulibacillus darangshiensis]|uniref:Putative hydrolase of HD superfamily n=1 Tax=Scopulibacillus darangshiensis TaxID=442528 RepID=A0A4R2PA84_9BACL|nr:HD domain-containing protein [Scopulibacillus darangshiensis]TCP31278.1 putative hydrolase of HD superfamily [Scopulibacillus darangshiensis]